MAEILDITPRRVKGPRANYSEATYGNDIYSCTDEDTCFFFGKEYHVPGLDPTSESYLTLTESGFKLSGLQTVLDNIVNNMSTQSGDIEDLESAFNTFLNSTDITDTTINRWKEIENFLTGITDTQTLTGLLESQKNTIDNYTVNSKKISTNPVLKATDIEIGIDDFDINGTMVPTSKISEALSNTSNWLMNQVPYSANIEQDANNVYAKFFSLRNQGLDNCSLTIPSATTTYAGLMSAADKTKFDNLSHTYASGDSVIYTPPATGARWIRIAASSHQNTYGIISIYNNWGNHVNTGVHFTFNFTGRNINDAKLTQIGGVNSTFTKARITTDSNNLVHYIEVYYNQNTNGSDPINISLSNTNLVCRLLTTPTDGFIPEGGSAKEFEFTDGMMANNFKGNLIGTADRAKYIEALDGRNEYYSPDELDNATYGNYGGIVQKVTDNIGWLNRLKILHGNSDGYFTDLGMSFTGTEGVYYRRMMQGTLSDWKRLAFVNETTPYKYLGGITTAHGFYVVLSYAYDGIDDSINSYFMGTVYIDGGYDSKKDKKIVINVQCSKQSNYNIANYQILSELIETFNFNFNLYKIRYNNTAYIALKRSISESNWSGVYVSGLFDPDVVRVIDSDDANVVEVEALNTTPYIDSYAKGVKEGAITSEMLVPNIRCNTYMFTLKENGNGITIENIYRNGIVITNDILNQFDLDWTSFITTGTERVIVNLIYRKDPTVGFYQTTNFYSKAVTNNTLVFEKFDYDTLQTTYIKVTLGNTPAECTVETKSPVWSGTQADYDAISSKDPNTLYYTFES